MQGAPIRTEQRPSPDIDRNGPSLEERLTQLQEQINMFTQGKQTSYASHVSWV